ncbi:MAG TPA: sensor domain-containing diguanylate cyclase [Candidatus Sulfotelmatobacter sp.]|nr:sensor domain-containing diguanylate cyclase [Candidatus Sulfotelmatobacter sp.]
MSPLDKALNSLLDLGDPAVRRDRAEQLDQALRTLLALTEGDATVIMLPGRAERLVLHSGTAAPSITPVSPEGSEAARTLAQTPQPIVIEELADHPRYAAHDGCPGVEAGPVMFAALRRRGADPGYLAVYRRRGRPRFSVADVRAIVLLTTVLQRSLEALRLARGLEKLAFTDDLTEVYNARFVKSALKREARRAARFGQELSLLLVEADRALVENAGDASDELIRDLAAQLVRQVRSFDFVARFDAGQFIVVLPQTGRTGAVEVAERIRQAIEAHAFRRSRPGGVTVSIGISVLPENGAEPQVLVAVAGRSLAAAQGEGGNRVESRLDRAA